MASIHFRILSAFSTLFPQSNPIPTRHAASLHQWQRFLGAVSRQYFFHPFSRRRRRHFSPFMPLFPERSIFFNSISRHPPVFASFSFFRIFSQSKKIHDNSRKNHPTISDHLLRQSQNRQQPHISKEVCGCR